ncbi:MAG: ABC transporter permease [Bacteroidales bacterium]
MRDIFEEIFTSIRKNKLRTALTGFSIAWGIFMLIVLLGAGNGLQNGMMSNFNFMSSNSLTIYPGRTSMPFGGYQKGRSIKLKEEDGTLLKESFQENIPEVSPVISKQSLLSYKQDYTNTRIQGVLAPYQKLRNIKIKHGRFINEIDEQEHRKVIVIHKKTQETLLRNTAEPLGEYIRVGNIPFQVIGIYDDKGGSHNPEAIAPFSTISAIFNPDLTLGNLSVDLTGINTKEESENFVTRIREKLGRKYHFNPTDMNALWIWDRLKDYLQSQGIFNGIALFIWIIGIGTLIAGIVGVSNIMLITVKERTREFGIRKALGATPASILRLVLLESIFITSLFGYIGMVFGIGLTELVNMAMEKMPQSNDGDTPTIFLNPTVELNIVFMATGILIVAGLIAGYVPAKKAVNIKPIDALRGE